MAYDRNLLAFKDIEAFQKWLDENQLAWRPGKGAHQIMQVALKDSWTAISVSEKKAVTTSPALREMIQRFKKGLPYTGKTPRIDKDTQVQLAESPDSFIEDLRDDFAIAALGMLAHQYTNQGQPGWSAERIAAASYEIADAMIKQRNK